MKYHRLFVILPLLLMACKVSTSLALTKATTNPQGHQKVVVKIHRQDIDRVVRQVWNKGVTALREKALDETSSAPIRRPLDVAAVAKYGIGLAIHVSLLYAVLTGIDALVDRGVVSSIPFAVSVVFFYACNLATSVLSPFARQSDAKNKSQKIKPTWTPPGFVFAIMWPIVVFGIRAVTASMIVRDLGGSYANLPIMLLMLHLTIANWWNTVNNVEGRLGVSVIVLYLLALTKALTAYQFYQINPLAGKLLACTLTWLCAAAALETNTWQLNPDVETGKVEPLYPGKADKWKTKFVWET